MALLEKITCPHCWFKMDTHAVLWISSNPQLRGDKKLGRDAERRFLPTRFTSDGFGIDETNDRCHRIACASCHLEIPRGATEMASWIVSVIGAPGSGKSFYLGALSRTLRRLLLARFRVSFTDVDAELNRLINSYEDAMFSNPFPDTPIDPGKLIPKTQKSDQQADLYNRVLVNNEWVLYPRPFMFAIRPDQYHPNIADPTSATRLLCLYDNAGESFQPGGDSFSSPVTRHLAQASVLIFLYDPTQDAQFRNKYLSFTASTFDSRDRLKLRSQHTELTEAANRIRQLNNLPDGKKHDKPLFVVVTKQDLWGAALLTSNDPSPMLLTGPNGIACLNMDRIAEMSATLRDILFDTSPGFVDAAESFAHSVVYVGASSLGVAPQRDSSGASLIRPRDINPVGVEVPLLFGLSQSMPGLFPRGRLQSNPIPPNRK